MDLLWRFPRTTRWNKRKGKDGEERGRGVHQVLSEQGKAKEAPRLWLKHHEHLHNDVGGEGEVDGGVGVLMDDLNSLRSVICGLISRGDRLP